MRHSQFCFLFAFALSLILLVGCGPEGGQAEPADDMDDVARFLADNPDQNVDVLEEDDAEEDEEDMEE